jgi:hypothetical protein
MNMLQEMPTAVHIEKPATPSAPKPQPTSLPVLTRRAHSSPLRKPSIRLLHGRLTKVTNLELGDSIVLPHYGSVMRGFVRYIGPVHFATTGCWVGVELLDPSRLTKLRHTAPDKKLHDGSVGGVRYFQAEHPRSSLFVRRSECLLTAKQGRGGSKRRYKSSYDVFREGQQQSSDANDSEEDSAGRPTPRKFSLSSSLNFRRTKSDSPEPTHPINRGQQGLPLPSRHSETFENVYETTALSSPPMSPPSGRKRSNSWSGEPEPTAERVWTDSMVFDREDQGDDDPGREGTTGGGGGRSSGGGPQSVAEDVGVPRQHSMGLDLVTLKNMVDKLTSDRDEAIHHLEDR